ncbi:hypothetical protein AAKU67_003334, partial [Oxalobacteraceae bacterium GrIS 2.11]
RTVKRLCANDSAATSVKVGYRQAVLLKNPRQDTGGGFCFGGIHFVVNGHPGNVKIVGTIFLFRMSIPAMIEEKIGRVACHFQDLYCAECW